jgi:hypothetical protein
VNREMNTAEGAREKGGTQSLEVGGMKEEAPSIVGTHVPLRYESIEAARERMP